MFARCGPLAVHPPASTPTIQSDPPEVLCFGTLRSNKGIDVLLEAIEHLAPRRAVRFRFAGRGVASVEVRGADRVATRRSHRGRARLGDARGEGGVLVPAGRRSLCCRTARSPPRALCSPTPTHTADRWWPPMSGLGADGPKGRLRVGDPAGDPEAMAAAIATALDDRPGWEQRAASARTAAAARTPEAVAGSSRVSYDRLA